MNSGLFNIVRTGYARSGQKRSFQFRVQVKVVKSGQVGLVWTGTWVPSSQDRSVQVRSIKSRRSGKIRSGQVWPVRSGQDMSVTDRSIQVCQVR